MRRSFFSLFLSFLAPGFGILYNGHLRKFIFTYTFLWVLIFFLKYVASTPLLIWLTILLILVDYLFGLIDAFRSSYSPVKSVAGKWYVLVPALVTHFVVSTYAIDFLANNHGYINHSVAVSPNMESTLLVGDHFTHLKEEEYTGNSLVTFIFPVDSSAMYVKRCVAAAGEKLEIKDGQLFVDNDLIQNQADIQHMYFLEADRAIRERIWDELQIREYYQATGPGGKHGYFVITSQAKANKLQEYPFTASMEAQFRKPDFVEPDIFPDPGYFKWNRDQYGPMIIPARGMKIEINKLNLAMYGSTITDYEDHSSLEIFEDKLILNGEEVSEYTFRKNYYFMLGDSRHNSFDSRYWGFVPDDHMIGKVSSIWLSWNSEARKIRWERIAYKPE